LCESCYPKWHDFYPSRSHAGLASRGDFRPKPPEHPTAYLPGSPGKVLVMIARLAAGRHLHQPLDARGGPAEDARERLARPAGLTAQRHRAVGHYATQACTSFPEGEL
jgi:hypothetical protein